MGVYSRAADTHSTDGTKMLCVATKA